MDYESFLHMIISLQKQSRILSNLNMNSVDLVNFVEPYHVIIGKLIKEIYGEEGLDWIEWFCYENNFGTAGLTAHNDKGEPICHSYQSLWEYIQQYKKT